MKLLGMEAENNNNININCGYCNKSIKKKSLRVHQKTKKCLEHQKEKDSEETVDNFGRLLEDGIIVIPGPENIQGFLKNFLKEQIEFEPDAELFVMGSFGALGNPSSYHHPEILEIRKRIYKYIRPIFENTTEFKGKNLEMLFDRFCIRKEGAKLSGESWHRDIGHGLEDDKIFGGWINLDPEGSDPQRFSCVPKTHIYDKTDKTGFVKFEADQLVEFKSNKKIFEIPPGHMILFFQDIVHEVLSRKSKFDSYRLFTGFRITTSSECLYDNSEAIENQGVPLIPSGQRPTIYSKMHLICWKDRIIDFTRKVKPQFRENIKEDVLVQKEMINLRESGLKMFPKYTEEDKLILKPQKLNV